MFHLLLWRDSSTFLTPSLSTFSCFYLCAFLTRHRYFADSLVCSPSFEREAERRHKNASHVMSILREHVSRRIGDTRRDGRGCAKLPNFKLSSGTFRSPTQWNKFRCLKQAVLCSFSVSTLCTFSFTYPYFPFLLSTLSYLLCHAIQVQRVSSFGFIIFHISPSSVHSLAFTSRNLHLKLWFHFHPWLHFRWMHLHTFSLSQFSSVSGYAFR